jgi:hypothetical protein
VSRADVESRVEPWWVPRPALTLATDTKVDDYDGPTYTDADTEQLEDDADDEQALTRWDAFWVGFCLAGLGCTLGFILYFGGGGQ